MRICPHCFTPLSDEALEQRIYDRCIIRVGQLEGENEKLRELVRDLWARRDSLLDFGFYAEVAEQLDKLGIEVEP